MKLAGPALLAVLGLYSAWLIGVEINTSQAGVRPYFSDIEDVAPLFGVNTTLSTFLLAGTALLMLFAAFIEKHGLSRRGSAFLISQASVFGFLAADDRFQIHERLAWRLGVADHYVMLLWALTELCFLAAFCRPSVLTVRSAILFLIGVGFFTIMFVIDAFAPAAAPLRLSIEDLAKTWAAAMFFGFGWEVARHHLRGRGALVNDSALIRGSSGISGSVL